MIDNESHTVETIPVLGTPCVLVGSVYANNQTLALQLFTWRPETPEHGEPYATMSVNLPESSKLEAGQFFLKDWSENEEAAVALTQNFMIEVVKPHVRSSIGAYAYRLTKTGLDHVAKANKLNLRP